MKQTEARTIERKYVIAEFCDWCGKRIATGDMYETREFRILFSVGDSFPEGGYKKGWQVEDLCDDCVANLRTLLEDAGIKIKPIEVDW